MKNTTELISAKTSDLVLANKNILIVDDEPLVTRVVSANLRIGGFNNVSCLTDPREVMETIRASKPDLVILDILMPHINGLELLGEICSNPEYNNIIVLMLSAAGKEQEIEALELGALGFLPKPASQSDLIRIVSTVFRIADRFGSR